MGKVLSEEEVKRVGPPWGWPTLQDLLNSHEELRRRVNNQQRNLQSYQVENSDLWGRVHELEKSSAWNRMVTIRERRREEDQRIIESLKREVDHTRKQLHEALNALASDDGGVSYATGFLDAARVLGSLPVRQELDTEIQKSQRRMVAEFSNFLWGDEDAEGNRDEG